MGCFSSKKQVTDSTSRVLTKISDAEDLKVTPSTFIQLNSRSFQDVYRVGNRLGAGSFAEVRRCEHKVTGQIRAVKIYRKEKVSSTELQALMHESDILKHFDHPNIVRIYEMFEDVKRYYIVMEHCKGGELFYSISAGNYFTEIQAAHIMHQLLSVVAYIHDLGVVHRDLKPENILLEDKGTSYDVKVVDFGAAARLGPSGRISGTIGTSYYIAPEVISGSYNEKCDEWSCGVIMYILLTGKPPFAGSDDKEILEKVRSGVYSLDIPEMQNVSKEAVAMLRKLLCPASTRFSAKQALLHPWIQTMSVHEFNHSNVSAMTNVLANLKSFTQGKKLKEAVQTFIATQLLSAQETKELREVFREIDKNGDGKLSRQELLDEYLKTMDLENAEVEVTQIMARVDTDHSGFIDYTEFLRASLDMKKVLNANNLEMAFTMIDEDGSGKISAAELQKLLGSESLCDDQVWRQIIGQVDQNGDGEIDLKEFKDIVLASL